MSVAPARTRARFAVLGSGASTAVPWLQCVIGTKCCAVCDECRRNPATSRNVRNNPSALISLFLGGGEAPRHVMIDAGKTMRAAVGRWFPVLGVTELSAVLLTHPHADAFLGLDDLRDISPRRMLPVYLTRACFAVVQRTFSYLVPRGSVARLESALGYGIGAAGVGGEDGNLGGLLAAARGASAGPDPGFAAGSKPSTTFIAMLEWRIITVWQPFAIPEAGGIVVTPVPVQHGAGPNNVSLAFEFGARLAPADAAAASSTASPAVSPEAPASRGAAAAPSDAATCADIWAPPLPGDRVLYISDVSALTPAARAYFRARPTTLAFLDLLNYMTYATHFNAQQAVSCAMDLAAAVTRFVGINHALDHTLEHAKLAAFGAAQRPGPLDLGLAHDGLTFDFEVGLLPGGAGGGLVGLAADIAAVRAAAAAAVRKAQRSGGALADDDPSTLIDYLRPELVDFLPESSPTKLLLGGP